MGFLNKLFGSKDKQEHPSQEATLTDEERRQEELNRKFHSIFPYFKQLLPSDVNSTSENLPDGLSKVDRQKTYSIPGQNLVIRNICDDLNCLYVYDNESGLEIIQESELNKLSITKDELHEIAMSNYRQLVSQRLNAQNNGEAFWFILDGNLEAGLVLVDEIWNQVEGHLNEEIVICVPSRDVIIATGKSNENVIADFTEKAKQILTTGDHPLSNNWFIRKNKQWNVFRKIIA
jgi:Asp-tRNA(Asn)/Glu-tRNA(Gln) amidotransferase C subunit